MDIWECDPCYRGPCIDIYEFYRYLKVALSIFSFLDICIDLWISMYLYPYIDIHI